MEGYHRFARPSYFGGHTIHAQEILYNNYKGEVRFMHLFCGASGHHVPTYKGSVNCVTCLHMINALNIPTIQYLTEVVDKP